MPVTLDPELRRALAERIRFYNELGIYDFYRREAPIPQSTQVPNMLTPGVYIEEAAPSAQPELREDMTPRRATAVAMPVVEENMFEVIATKPEHGVADPVKALKVIREDLGDCTRCVLHKQGRKQIVFGVGNPKAELMFVGEGPGADEDAQGIPFVGRAGQLLTQMIEGTAKREGIPLLRKDVYICNVVKCRPPGNRTPEPDEMESCSPFLFRQLEAIRPKAICALGGTAAKGLLKRSEGVTKMRGKWYEWRGIPVMVTYHPSYLLRPYNQDAKREAWEDLKKVLHRVYD